MGLVQLQVFAEEGADLTRVAVGHCDSHPDLKYHQAILETGAFVEFDLVRGQSEHDTAVQVRLLCELAARGHVGRLLISQDVCSPRAYTPAAGLAMDTSSISSCRCSWPRGCPRKTSTLC